MLFLASEEVIPYLKEMYLELLSEYFVAYQVSAGESRPCGGGNIWVAECSNPNWYKDLVEKYPKNRDKPWAWEKKASLKLKIKDSVIKRGNLKKILLRLSSGKTSRSKYAEDLLFEAKKRFLSGRDSETEAEFVFFDIFGISLKGTLLIETINRIPIDFWKDIATHYHKTQTFPEWLFLEEIPF